MVLVREFETLEGTVLQLRPLSPMLLQTLELQWAHKKPQPPIVEVEINGHWRKDTNPSDPTYLECVQLWEREKGEALYSIILSLGVLDEPPQDAIELYRSVLPDASPAMIKYFWITTIVNMDGELNALSERILGQTMPTEKGLEQSAERFPGHD